MSDRPGGRGRRCLWATCPRWAAGWRGYCRTHYWSARRHGLLGGPACSQCDQPVHAKGLCSNHYQASRYRSREGHPRDALYFRLAQQERTIAELREAVRAAHERLREQPVVQTPPRPTPHGEVQVVRRRKSWAW